MKKILILVLLFFVLSANAYAYTVRFKDSKAYSGQDGNLKKETPTQGTFEIDIESGYIYEKSTIVDGVDAAKYNPTRWEIVQNENRNIVGVSLEGRGEDIISFRNDGTYYLFQAFHNVPVVNVKSFHSFFYGKYERID